MNNPYKSDKNRTKYFRYRYVQYKYNLKHEDCIKYAEANNQFERKKILGDLKHLRPNRKPQTNNMVISYKPVIDPNYVSYDKNNIINENKFYIFYKDKVWSKSVDKYINILSTSKRKYAVLRDTETGKSYTYTIS